MKPFRLCCVAVFLIFSGAMSSIADPKPVVLAPIAHQDAALEVVGADGTRTVYSPASLEQFPTYQIETVTPWRNEPAVFAGVLLSDVLAHHDLLSAALILVTAENEFSSGFDRSVLEAAPILIATRVNGAPHSRRARGPIQFVVEDLHYQSQDVLNESHLVWMASRIEAAQ